MSKKIAFIRYLMDRLNLNSEELANFLFVEKRTLYNYKNLCFEKLPNKVHEKVIIFFQGYEEFYKEGLTMQEIYETLTNLDDNTVEYLRNRFLEVATIRKTTYVNFNTKEYLKKNDVRRDVDSLGEFLTDFKMLVEYSDLTKGYLYTTFEIIINKVDNKNDYAFLEHINKYEKGKK